MKNNEFAVEFIDLIDAHGVVPLLPEEVGRLITVFPVLGGGGGYLDLGVEDTCVRVTTCRGYWIAEYLLVSGSE